MCKGQWLTGSAAELPNKSLWRCAEIEKSLVLSYVFAVSIELFELNPRGMSLRFLVRKAATCPGLSVSF